MLCAHCEKNKPQGGFSFCSLRCKYYFWYSKHLQGGESYLPHVLHQLKTGKFNITYPDNEAFREEWLKLKNGFWR